MNDDPSTTPSASPTSRRDFLKTTAGATAATAFSAATHAHAAGSDSFKVALVGAGGRGSGAVVQTLLNEGTEFMAVAEAYQDRLDLGLENIMKSHKGAGKIKIPEKNKFIGLEAYKEAIDQCDVCILTTPPGFRPMMFEYAVSQGKHVFMEKPVCTDAAGYQKVIAAAKQADEKGLKVVVGLQRRYADNYQEAYREVHENGAIGEVVGAQCFWNGGGVWTRPRAKLAETLGREPTEMEYQYYNWYYFTWIGGDNICEQHVHNLDVVNWFLGDHPSEAYGGGGRATRTGVDTGYIFDHHYIEYKFADGRISNSQSRHFRGADNQVGEVIIGTEGRLEMGSGVIFDRKGDPVKRIQAKASKKEGRNPYEVEHAELYRAIRQDQPLNNAYYGADSSMTAVLGRMSTYTGKRLKWDAAIKSQVELSESVLDSFPEKLAWDALPRVLPDAEGLYGHAVPGVSRVVKS